MASLLDVHYIMDTWHNEPSISSRSARQCFQLHLIVHRPISVPSYHWRPPAGAYLAYEPGIRSRRTELFPSIPSNCGKTKRICKMTGAISHTAGPERPGYLDPLQVTQRSLVQSHSLYDLVGVAVPLVVVHLPLSLSLSRPCQRT